MKANEAPNKIYLNPLLTEDGESVVRQFALSISKAFQIGLQVGYNARQINLNKPN